MFRLSKLADYATVLMSCLADAPGTLHSASLLAERTRLEETTVAKLLKQLAQQQLVESVRGARGGYRLARPADQVSVAEIISAIEGPIAWTDCSLHQVGCHRESYCGVSSNLRKIAGAIQSALDQVKLSDLTAPPATWRPRISVDRLPQVDVIS